MLKLEIGMTIEEAIKLFAMEDITNVHDTKNGYYWIRGWYNLFSERTYIEACFKDGFLWRITISPHLSVEKDRSPFSLDMDDYRICQEWIAKHREQLPKGTKAYYEPKTPSVGVVIR